jgi:hypothetical protein
LPIVSYGWSRSRSRSRSRGRGRGRGRSRRRRDIQVDLCHRVIEREWQRVLDRILRRRRRWWERLLASGGGTGSVEGRGRVAGGATVTF